MADDILLQNGSVGRFRPVEPDDRDALVTLHGFLSDRRTYLRFIGLDAADAGVFIDGLLRSVQDGDAYSEVCLVRNRLVGIGSYVRSTDDSAETVFVVADTMRHLGIGTLLLERLADHAEGSGIREFVTRVLSSDSAALEVLSHSGFVGTTFDTGGEIEIRFPVTMTDRLAHAVAERQDVANLASLDPLLRPRSVAVITQSLKGGAAARTVLDHLSSAGFSGPIYPVVPEPDATVAGRTYRSIHDVPEPVDLALLTVPADLTARTVQNCADAGIRAVAVLSSGFAESNAHGLAEQDRTLAITRANGIRLLGPNSAGLLNTAPGVDLDATTFESSTDPGTVALITQSRSIGMTVLEQMRESGVGISTFASLGNKADVSGNDLLSYLARDDRTTVIAMYTETVGNPRRFSRIARTITRTKPVVAMVSGPHCPSTGQLRGVEARDLTVRGLFRQCGVAQASSLAHLIDVTRMLADQPLPEGRRVAVISASRGLAAVTADALLKAGLQLAEFDSTTAERIGPLFSGTAAVANPLVLPSDSSIETNRIVRLVAECVDVDAVIIGARSGADPSHDASVREQIRDTGTPVLTVALGQPGTAESDSPAPSSLVFRYPEAAAAALATVADYAEYRRRDPGEFRQYDELRPRAARELLDNVLRRSPEGRWLGSDETRQLLTCYGIDPVATIESAGADQVLDAARWIGYPVVLKTPVRGVEHREDRGGIRTHLDTREAVRAAYRDMLAAGALPDNDAVVLQRQAPRGAELTLGIANDENFGPLVSFGIGGKNAELLDDLAMCLTPLTQADAAATVRAPRSSPLLFGYRGSPPTDTAAIEDLLQRLGRLADDQPALDELRLHVIAHPTGTSVIDATAAARPPRTRARFTSPLDAP